MPLQELQQKELELVSKWKKSRDKEALAQLMKSLEPILYKNITKWRGGSLPEEVLYAQGLKLLYKGIETFDPSKNVKLSTHITNQLLPLSRITYTYSNVARIPENRIQRLNLFKETLDVLTDKLKRRPTTDELADYLHWSKKMVEQTNRDLFKDTLLQEGYMHVPVTHSSPNIWTIDFYYHSLSPKEKLLFEDLTGYGGRPVLPESTILKTHKITKKELDEFREKTKNTLRDLINLRLI